MVCFPAPRGYLAQGLAMKTNGLLGLGDQSKEVRAKQLKCLPHGCPVLKVKSNSYGFSNSNFGTEVYFMGLYILIKEIAD